MESLEINVSLEIFGWASESKFKNEYGSFTRIIEDEQWRLVKLIISKFLEINWKYKTELP